MPQYKAPLRDMQFVLHELLNAETHYAKLPAFQGTVSRELVDQYLEAAADFCENELSPLSTNQAIVKVVLGMMVLLQHLQALKKRIKNISNLVSHLFLLMKNLAVKHYQILR